MPFDRSRARRAVDAALADLNAISSGVQSSALSMIA